MAEHSHDKHDSGGGGSGRWVFLGFVLIAGYFLLTEHRAHVWQYLPFALLLACPLLHMFHGHGGHGGHGGEQSGERNEKSGKDTAAADKPVDSKKHGCH
jgi:hypothetical protein